MSTVRRFEPQATTTPPVTSEILDRQPPCNTEAERCILGSIMLLPHVCDEVANILRPDDFYDDANRRLYERMVAMHDGGGKIDLALLVEELKKAGDFEVIGGPAYLARVSKSVPNAAHAEYYARIVRDKAAFRSLIDASTEILREAYDETADSKEMVSRAEQKIFSILDKRESSSVSNVREILNDALDRIDARMKGEHAFGGVDTLFADLDGLLGGLHNSELIILAARPSMGKTALAMNIAANAAIRSKVPTLFVSLEMSNNELADRLICCEARVNGHRLRNGTLSQGDRHKLVEHAAEISEAPFFVDDSPSRTVTEIAAAARRIRRRQGGLGLIVIDYLQLVEPDNSNDARQEQVAKIARRLKGLAREMRLPVLCLAQLNRQAEESKGNVPRLSHLRESGAIEQDADVVMFIHREEYYHTHESEEDRQQFEGKADLIVAKQRNGPTGKIDLTWKKEFTRFEDTSHRAYADSEAFTVPEPEFDF